MIGRTEWDDSMPRYGQVTRRQFLGWSAAALAAMSAGAGAIAYRTDAVGAADTLSADILIAGGGVGGVAAALAALKLGRSVILTEETDWLGGQLTAQAVPPDENPWIETTGCTASYRQFRNDVRSFYRQNYALRKAPYANPYLNPGMGTVSALCHEAPVSLAVLTATLKQTAALNPNAKLTVLLRHVPKSVTLNGTGDQINAVTFTDLGAGNVDRTVQAAYVLDATELGDLLPLANVDFVTGAESKKDQRLDTVQPNSEELHALDGDAQPLDQQAVSWCFPMEYIPGEDFTINKPNNYDKWSAFTPKFQQPWPGKLLSWTDTHPETLQPRTRYLFEGPTSQDLNGDMWHYRRIFWHDQCLSGIYPSDVTVTNWPQSDYWLTPLAGPKGSAFDKQTALTEAKELSMALLYWMQTEAPHDPSGSKRGYPGLRTRPDLTGTPDGFAKSVYVRESRRIKAAFTIYEKYVGVGERQQRNLPPSAEVFPDSVGIGYYRIDLHPSHGDGNRLYNGRTYVDVASYRFQIPLGAFIQQNDKVKNLLPACKNIGTTHITNGCYRLHPVEWNIGEAAGALAAYCLNTSLGPSAVYAAVKQRTDYGSDFQNTLRQLGFVLVWPQVNEQEAPDGRRYGGGG